MSQETLTWLNTNVLVGFTDTRGKAWHFKASEQGAEPNHYPGAIPVGDVMRRLFYWTPESLPVYVAVPADIETMSGMDTDGNPIRMAVVPGRQAIGRSDTHEVFSIFKEGYQAHSYNEWLLGNVTNLLGGEVGIGSAGLLRNGAQAWVQVEIPESISTKHGVDFRPNLLAYTSLDGSLATGYKPTIGIVVCDNTLSGAMSENSDTVKIKHTRYSNLRITEAQQALGILESMADSFEQELQTLIEWEVTEAQFDALLDKLCAPSGESSRAKTMADNKRSAVAGLYRHDERAATWAGTAFGVLQAFNTYETHLSIIRGGERVERNMGNVLSGKSFDNDAEVLKVLATC